MSVEPDSAIVTDGRGRCKQAAASPTPLWTLAFRPFFLAASLWAAVAIVLWIAVLLTGRTPPSRFDPLSWHIHEMLFGFVPAAVAGFILTAVANWTGRPGIRGAPLGALAALWLTGRIACLCSARLPLWLAAALDVSFPFAVAALALRQIVLARNWRNLAMPAPIAILGVGSLLMYLSLMGLPIAPALGWHLGLAAILILASSVAGRIVPGFTHNWLVKRGAKRLPATRGALDRIALGTLHAALLGWALLADVWPAGAHPLAVLLLSAAALNAWRLARWRALATLSEPLLAVLHLGYAWLIVGVALLGASLLHPALPLAAAIHALTVGVIGTLVLAVMSRVSLGHTGRPLHAGRLTVLIYLLINAAALARIAAELFTGAFLALLLASAAAWVAAFIVFSAGYAPIWAAPRAD